MDGGDVGGGNLGVELGELVEEGCVDDADALVELGVGCSLDGSGNEDIAGFVREGWEWGWGGCVLLDACDNHLASLGGELGDSLEVEGAADGGDIGEGLEDLGEAGVLAVVEQDD